MTIPNPSNLELDTKIELSWYLQSISGVAFSRKRFFNFHFPAST
jgi:hypothetical protein